MPPRRFHFKPFALAAVAILAILLGISHWGHRLAGSAVAPLVSIANWTGELLLDSLRLLQPGRHSRQTQLHVLQARLEELETQVAATSDLRRQNAELRREAALAPPPDWHGILAEIISRDPERWDERLMVAAGSEEGVATGAVVMVNGIVLGRVLRTYRHSAEIVTVLSDECRFGVMIEDTGEVGILQGLGARRWAEGQPGFQVDYLPRDLQVPPGKLIRTSGLGGWIPDGLAVGKILPVRGHDNAVQVVDASYGRLKGAPMAPLDACHFVTVIVPQQTLAQ